MAKHLIRRITPDHDTIRNHKHLRVFGTLLRDPNLWHFNRRSASGAFAVGLFMAFMPLPMQMVFAAGAAILFRVNLPLSVVLVWVSNPLTIPPLFYFAYLVGNFILGQPPAAAEIEFELSAACVMESLSSIWAPLLLGSFICGSVLALIGYFGVRGLWRLHLVQHLKQRRERAKVRKAANPKSP